jgi:predicted MPP superfamily phosphohydrolase/drug/metabolite transporter (DMT)-like permease
MGALRSRAFLLTLITLFAFAGNSILARLALHDGSIDPVAFTAVRLASGALMLALIVLVRSRSLAPLASAKWQPAAALSVYALAFSLAYISLDAGTGALLLFAAVQATMIGAGIVRGDRPGPAEWAGIALALAGLGWLMAPGLTAPPLAGALLMTLSGVCWGFYSLLGQGEADPVAATARNFVFSLPVVAALSLFLVLSPAGFEGVTTRGFVIAALSGTITSGLGYVIWYTALRHLTTTIAAVVQLAVPIIAAAGGVALMGEVLTARLVSASVLILGGIYLTIRAHNKPEDQRGAGLSAFMMVALALHLPLFAYPVLRLSHWLDLGQAATIAIFVPIFFSQIFARRTLRNKQGKHIFFLRNAADFLLGLFFVMLMVLLVFEVLRPLFSLSPLFAAQAVLVLTGVIVGYGVVLAFNPKVVSLVLTSDKLSRPIRFVQITDVHIGSRSTRFLNSLMARIEKLDVDFLCITGDFIDQPGISAEQLGALGRYDKPIYYCIGNHERYEDLEPILERLRSHGVHVLRNTSLMRDHIQFVGIDDMEDKGQVARQLKNIEISKDHYSILLYHRPNGLEAAHEHGIDLMISGHTHGGQIMPFNLLVKRVFEHTKGMHILGNSRLYVSEGTGTWGPVVRLGTRSEITLFEIQPE